QYDAGRQRLAHTSVFLPSRKMTPALKRWMSPFLRLKRWMSPFLRPDPSGKVVAADDAAIIVIGGLTILTIAAWQTAHGASFPSAVQNATRSVCRSVGGLFGPTEAGAGVGPTAAEAELTVGGTTFGGSSITIGAGTALSLGIATTSIGKWTTSVGAIAAAVGASPQAVRDAIHSIKRKCPSPMPGNNNPDVEVDTDTGGVRYVGTEDEIGNIH